MGVDGCLRPARGRSPPRGFRRYDVFRPWCLRGILSGAESDAQSHVRNGDILAGAIELPPGFREDTAVRAEAFFDAAAHKTHELAFIGKFPAHPRESIRSDMPFPLDGITGDQPAIDQKGALLGKNVTAIDPHPKIPAQKVIGLNLHLSRRPAERALVLGGLDFIVVLHLRARRLCDCAGAARVVLRDRHLLRRHRGDGPRRCHLLQIVSNEYFVAPNRCRTRPKRRR